MEFPRGHVQVTQLREKKGKMKQKLTVWVLGLFTLSLLPVAANAVEQDGNNNVYFPSAAAYTASTPGSTLAIMGTNGVEEMEIYNDDDLNSDGLDGSLYVEVSEELNQANLEAYSVATANDEYSVAANTLSAGADLTLTREAKTVSGVSVQTKYRFFDPGQVVRMELLLTASEDTTRTVRIDGDFGSDGSTVLMAQRSLGQTTLGDWSGGITEINDNLMTSATQWFVSAEDDANNNDGTDPLMGTILQGTATNASMSWVDIPGDANEEDNWGVDYTVVLPANQTVSLVLFHMQFAHNGDVSNNNFSTYINGMNDFNAYSGNYFTGLTSGVPVLNWGGSATNRTIFYPLDEVTKKIAPSAPGSPVAAWRTSSTAQVKIARPAAIGSGSLVRYEIYRNGKYLTSVSSSTRFFIDRKLERGISYSYQVIAVSTDGSSSKSRMSNSIYRR